MFDVAYECCIVNALVLIVSFLFGDVRMRSLSEKNESISMRISKRKEEQMILEDEVHGQIANKGKPPLDAYLILIILLLHY
jgi:cell division protein FtsL